MAERKQYASLDIMKFIMAMLILTQHTANEWAHSTGLVHAFFGLGNFAVSFFFACSGFLFFSKLNTLSADEQKGYYKKWSLRIGKMYLIWSLIYFVFVLYGWIDCGVTIEGVGRYLHRAIVFSTYATIWFLPALWVGLSICYWMKRHCSNTMLWTTMVLLMIVGNLFGSYSNVLVDSCPEIAPFYDGYMDWFITWRNGVFNGAPYVFIGILVAEGWGKNIPIKISAVLAVLCALAFVCEAFCITRFKFSTATDMGFMMVPAIYFLMTFLVSPKISLPTSIVWTYCRNLSMLIFLSQRLFLSALPGMFPVMAEWIGGFSEGGVYVYFVVVVLFFSWLIIRLSSRFKSLKVLW